MLSERRTEELLPLMEAAFAAGGYFRLWPRGRSMLPLLREGVDSVLLAPPKEIALDDILLIKAGDGSFLLHRAVAMDEGGITVAGDALLSTEGPFSPSCVLARAVCIYRGDLELDVRAPRLLRYARRIRRRRRFLSLLQRAKARLEKK